MTNCPFTAKQFVEEERDESEDACSSRIDLDNCVFFVSHWLNHVARHEEVEQDLPEHEEENEDDNGAKSAIISSLEIRCDLDTLVSQVPDIVVQKSTTDEGKNEGDTERPALPIFDILSLV